MAQALAPISGRTLLLLAAAGALLWFGNLEYRDLVRPDEGRYAEIAREMAVTGDWVTPRLNGLKYFEKPPLQYWATAAAYRVLGESHFTARLWPALTSFAGLLVVFATGCRLFGARAGLAATAVLASSMLYCFVGHFNALDAGLTFFLAAALGAFLVAQQPSTSEQARRRTMLVAWAALALATLSKGLVALVLPAGTLVLYSLLTRDVSPWFRLELVRGIALYLLVTAPWFVVVSLKNPEFVHFFFVHEHFARYLTTVHRRVEPWWYFLPILALGTLPWLFSGLGAIRQAWRKTAPPETFAPRRFLLAWIGFVLLFFSVSGSKLPSYVLPLFPALALLTGEHVQAMPARTLVRHCTLICGLCLLALAATAWLLHWEGAAGRETLYLGYRRWLVAACCAAAACTCAAVALARRHCNSAAVIALATGSILAWQIALMGHDELSPETSGRQLARQMQPYLTDQTPLFSVGTYDQTLPFYLQRTMTLVAFLDEMAFGAQQEPARVVPTLDAFVPLWRASPGALLVTTPEVLADLRGRGLALEVIARDPDRLVARAR